MFYFLSKILQFLTIPFVLIVGVLIASSFVKKERPKRILFRLGLGLLLFFSNDFIANEVMKAWEIPPVRFKDLEKHYSYGIVLSGFTRLHEDYDDRVFLGLDRITHAVQLYKAGVIDTLLISGGQGTLAKKRMLEAEQIEQVLLIMGVDKTRIRKESKSRNTHESAVAVAAFLQNVNPKQCLLITSGNHLRRAKACFDKAGFSAQPFATDLISHATEYSFEKFVVPSTNALWLWQVFFKEAIGFIAYKVMGYV